MKRNLLPSGTPHGRKVVCSSGGRYRELRRGLDLASEFDGGVSVARFEQFAVTVAELKRVDRSSCLIV